MYAARKYISNRLFPIPLATSLFVLADLTTQTSLFVQHPAVLVRLTQTGGIVYFLLVLSGLLECWECCTFHPGSPYKLLTAQGVPIRVVRSCVYMRHVSSLVATIRAAERPITHLFSGTTQVHLSTHFIGQLRTHRRPNSPL